MGKLNEKGLKGLLTKSPGRHPDGGGLFFKTIGQGRAYFTFRFTLNGKERELSLGAFPELTLDEVRIKHKRLVADVAAGIDPVGDRRSPKTALAVKSGAPTFGECADQFIALNEGGWKNSKHHQQWVMTLGKYCAAIRERPVNEITTADVLTALKPIWNEKPETASRLRGRIEAVIAAAQVDGWIPEDKPNPARWKNWLSRKLPPPKKLGSRGHHAAMPYDQLPAFMARLAETPGVASRALMFTILTCARTSEALNAAWDEIDFGKATWSIPKERMKMGEPHRVPLSAPALAILRALDLARGKNPFVFPGRPMRALSNMSMAMLLRRMKCEVTVHGFRSSFRNWATEIDKTEYATAERCLAHAVGSDAALAYDRSDRLELRRPVMAAWAQFITGSDTDNVVPLRPAQLSPDEQSVIDVVERSKGRPLTQEERHLSLAQASTIGDI